MAIHISEKHCVACEGGTPPMMQDEAKKMMAEVGTEWQLKVGGTESDRIERHFEFKDFKQSMVFVNRVAEIAEEEGHHPDIAIFYNKVDIALSTHAVKGLSENDFIVAAKIDKIPV